MIDKIIKEVNKRRAEVADKLIRLYVEQHGYTDMEKFRAESILGSDFYYYGDEYLFKISHVFITEDEPGKFSADFKIEIHKWVDIGGLES